MLRSYCLLPYKAICITSVGNHLHSGFTHEQSIADLSVLVFPILLFIDIFRQPRPHAQWKLAASL